MSGKASAFSIVGNYKLCSGITSLELPACSTQTSMVHGNHAIKRIIPNATVAFLLLLVTLYFVTLHVIEKSKRQKLSTMPCLVIGPVQVSYAELLGATDGFSPSKKIGEGSYDSV